MATDLHEHLDSNRELVRVLSSHGDQLQVPRKVEHLAVFRRKGPASAAAVELSAAGFQVSGSRRRLFRVLLEFDRVDPVDLETADRFTEEVHAIVARQGGDYDGWGCLVQDEPTA